MSGVWPYVTKRYLRELVQELNRFEFDPSGRFRCPACLKDIGVTSKLITEEHIIPRSVGGQVTTFLCSDCNSNFGSKQTRWLGDWVRLNEDDAELLVGSRGYSTRLEVDGHDVGGEWRTETDGSLSFLIDYRTTSPGSVEFLKHRADWSKIRFRKKMPVFANENALEVGFLTAAYLLWFKHCGYSFALQSSMNIVREQMMKPSLRIIEWNFLIGAPTRELNSPEICMVRLGKDYFPAALIYDHFVLLPSPTLAHPRPTAPENISVKCLSLGDPIADRLQHRCIGPAVIIVDGQPVIAPDLVKQATVSPQYCWVDGW